MESVEPRIDFSKIDFPSDKLTIKSIRQAWPTAVDIDVKTDFKFNASPVRKYSRDSLDEVLGVSILDTERHIAERAFKASLGQSLEGQSNLRDRDELVDFLTSEYTRYGLAHGEHDSMAMIRRIETQAEAQARQHGGRTP